MAENFLNLGREVYMQIYEAQRTLNNLNPNRAIVRHIIIIVKSQRQNKNSKNSKIKKSSYVQRNPHNTIDFLKGNIPSQERMGIRIQMLKKNTCQLGILYPAKQFFRNKGGIKAFLNKLKLREFITSRLALQEMRVFFE